MSSESLMIFTGNANPKLAQSVVDNLGIPLGKALVSKFSDGEIHVEIQENVRSKHVVILQPTCAPTNDNLMELMIMIDALKRASAGTITAAIPYFGYARQDRRPRSARVAISARVVANMLQVAGANRILTMDLHADQIQGFFDIPVDNIYGSQVWTQYQQGNLKEIRDYCETDVANTYLVYQKFNSMRYAIPENFEQEKQLLIDNLDDSCPHWREYLVKMAI